MPLKEKKLLSSMFKAAFSNATVARFYFIVKNKNTIRCIFYQ